MKWVQVILATIAIVFSFHSISIAGINEWTSIGPPGFWSKAIAIDPYNPDIVYVGSTCSGDGIYKSTDGGVSFEMLTNGPQRISCIVISPWDTRILYAGTVRDGVYKSTDGGESWRSCNNGLPRNPLRKIKAGPLAIDPEDPDRLYVGSDHYGVYRSVNGGNSWGKVGVEGILTRDIAIDPVDPDIVYAVTDFPGERNRYPNGVMKSTNGGDTWEEMNSGLDSDLIYSILCVAIDQNNPETVYIGTATSADEYNCVYKSTNGGGSWENITNDMNSIFTRDIALDPVHSGVIYVANEAFLHVKFGGFYKSTNDGLNWINIYENLTTHEIQKIAVNPVDPRILYIGTHHGGIFKSEDEGESWTDITDSTMKGNWVGTMAIDPHNTSVIYSNARLGLYKTTNRGSTWNRLKNGFPKTFYSKVVAIDPRNTQKVLLGTYYDGLYVSEDGGENWIQSNEGLGKPEWISTIVFSPDDPAGIYLGTTNGIYLSEDGGRTWNRPGNALVGENIFSFIIHPDDLNIRYTGTYDNVFKSTDAGQTWKLKMTGLLGTAFSLTMDPQESNILYVNNQTHSSDGGVFKSTDGGETWKEKNRGIPIVGPTERRCVAVLVIDPIDPEILYCADFGNGMDFTGIYMSKDRAEHWISIETELMVNHSVWDIKFDPQDHYTIYAGTRGASIATYTRADVDFVLEIEDKAVLQNSKDNKIYLNLENNSDICDLYAEILFDTTCFNITSIEETDRTEGFLLFHYEDIEGGVRLELIEYHNCINRGEGPIVEIQFDVGNCPEGFYSWSITNTTLRDPGASDISPVREDGVVVILSKPKGDINADGAINSLDVVLAVNIATGFYLNPTEDERLAADCNLDGEIDVTDVLGIVDVITGLGSCPP